MSECVCAAVRASVSVCAPVARFKGSVRVLFQGREEIWVGKKCVCVSMSSGRNDK